ncbi:DUF1385 domain-containing protein [Ruminococcaceae bacterium OttesenSCG-928-I18]|nr:DUF1385 domain-containing protein [Ruminococcaceae bacterium OttesenSCG-928-I18]
MAERCKFKTSVGGQAVMEGVMMKGPLKWCLAVRTPDGEITTETHDSPARPWTKFPFVRGVFNFFDSFIMGYQTMMRSAELSMEEDEAEEPSKFDLWLEKHFGEKGMKFVMALSAVAGIALAIFLFMFIPIVVVNFVDRFVALGGFKALLEGVIKVAIFIGYLALVRRMKEIRRVFSYHGAEHKTIACYESGEELTCENVHRHTRFHPRCGTSFLFIVIIISILLFSLVPWTGTLTRVLLKLLLLPVVMGVAYEIIRLAGRYDNPLTRAVSAPGMWLQRLTTEEPDDSMIEVAIAAVLPVLPPKPDEATW